MEPHQQLKRFSSDCRVSFLASDIPLRVCTMRTVIWYTGHKHVRTVTVDQRHGWQMSYQASHSLDRNSPKTMRQCSGMTPSHPWKTEEVLETSTPRFKRGIHTAEAVQAVEDQAARDAIVKEGLEYRMPSFLMNRRPPTIVILLDGMWSIGQKMTGNVL